VGENGAGKSTLIKILSGVHAPDAGEIYINGEKARINNPKDGLEHGVSVIYQEFVLVPHLSIMENIFLDEFRSQHKIINWKALRERTRELLNQLGFGYLSPDTIVGTLTVAYQQVVEICKALSRNCSILVLDEPTAVLTTKEIDRLFGILEDLQKRGISIIYITHRLEEIFQICDRITVLKDGTFVKTVEKTEIDKEELVNLMIGRNIDTYFPPRPEIEPGATVLEVENIKAGIQVKDVSFKLREGEVLGLTGLVGAGRTEAVRAIMGFDKLDGGKVKVYGKEVKLKSPKHSYRLKVGLLPEDRKTSGVLLKIPIKHNVTLSCLKKFSNRFKWLNLRKENRFVQKYCREIGIKAASLENPVSSLSGGNQQKVAIARLLASDCKILVLDEPTRGVDVGSKIEIFNIINSLVEQKYAILFISSEMAEVIGMCDRVVVMREGVTVGELQKHELTEQNIIRLSMGVNA
jgi:ribose transport system ATP-binding protein